MSFWGVADNVAGKFDLDYLRLVSTSRKRALEMLKIRLGKKHVNHIVLSREENGKRTDADWILVKLGEDTQPDSKNDCVYLVRDTNQVVRALDPATVAAQKKRPFYKRNLYNQFNLDRLYDEGIVNGSCSDENSNNENSNNENSNNENSNNESSSNESSSRGSRRSRTRSKNHHWTAGVNANNIPLLMKNKNKQDGGRRRKTRKN